ncbi:MAG: TRAP transporter substrate-binding protein [Lawsonibacter sp.]|nr:TRAP transporter substrate-binding protein [Lawsonibacter sp.]
MKKSGKRLTAMLLAGALLLLASCGVTPNAPTGGAAGSGSPSGSQPAAPSNTTVGDKPAVALEGASIVLKVSHPEPDTNMLATWNCYARTFKNSLEVYSNGEMTCDIYPNDQLGDLTSCMEQCSQGTLDICLSPGSGNLTVWVPDIGVLDIPYLVGDLDVNNLVLQGIVLQQLNEQMSEKASMHMLSAMTLGFRNIDAYTKPIRTVDDLKGLKFRLQTIDSHIAMAEAWGAVPTTVAFNELYSAASTGVIDLSDNCNYTLFMKNLQEVTKYISDTQHIANVCVALISDKTYNKLTPEQQDIVNRAAADARRASLGVVAASEISNTEKLLAAGVELISLTDEERQAFKDACYDYCLEKVLPTIDSDFYQLYLDEYATAAKMIGKA